jgi:hypothetical protein
MLDGFHGQVVEWTGNRIVLRVLPAKGWPTKGHVDFAEKADERLAQIAESLREPFAREFGVALEEAFATLQKPQVIKSIVRESLRSQMLQACNDLLTEDPEVGNKIKAVLASRTPKLVDLTLAKLADDLDKHPEAFVVEGRHAARKEVGLQFDAVLQRTLRDSFDGRRHQLSNRIDGMIAGQVEVLFAGMEAAQKTQRELAEESP